jgi:hypothetical protein
LKGTLPPHFQDCVIVMAQAGEEDNWDVGLIAFEELHEHQSVLTAQIQVQNNQADLLPLD